MKMKTAFAILITAIVAGSIGGYVGSGIGRQEEARTLQYHFYQSISTNMKIHVKLLEQLRDGKSEKASNMLEQLLDADLIALEAYVDPPKGTPKDLSDSRVDESLDLARSYRKRFPSTAQNPRVKEEIDKVLNHP